MVQDNLWHSCSPCAVYGVEAPTYAGRLFGCVNPGRFPDPDRRLRGSALVVTGAYLRPDALTGTAVREIAMVGLRRELEGIGLRFAERVTAGLVAPDERIVIYYWKRLSQFPDWSRAASVAGFDAYQTDEFTVCVGKGSMLPGFEWLEGVGSAGVGLIASGQTETPLEVELMNAARRKGDVGAVVDGFWDRVHEDPEAALHAINGYSLFATLGGPDFESLVVNRTSTNVTELQQQLRDATVWMGLPLYYVGSLSQPNEQGLWFADFEDWYRWRLIPKTWERIV